MKKLLALILVLAMLCATFVACTSESESDDGNEEGKTNDKESLSDSALVEDLDRYKVSKKEWETAFKFADVNSITAKIRQVVEENDVFLVDEGEAKYCDGLFVFTTTSQVGEGAVEKNSGIYKVDKITDMFPSYVAEFIREIEKLNNFGYSRFDFSAKKLGYTATIEVDDEDLDVTVSFEDQRISTLTLEGEVDGEYDELELVVEFSDYNTTKFTDADKAPYTVNAEQWEKAFDLSNIEEFSFIATESVGDATATLQGTYANGKMQGSMSNNVDGNHREESFDETMEIKDLEPFGLGEFIWELDDFEDYGYSLFKFSEKTFTYEAVMEIDDMPDVKVNVGLKDGKIVSVTLNGRYGNSGYYELVMYY